MVHVYLPDFTSVHRLTDALSPFGSLKSDGRPTLLMDAKDLLKIVLDIHPDLEDIDAIGIPRLSEAIAQMRKGKIRKLGGFDGRYGTVHVFS